MCLVRYQKPNQNRVSPPSKDLDCEIIYRRASLRQSMEKLHKATVIAMNNSGQATGSATVWGQKPKVIVVTTSWEQEQKNSK